MCTYVCVFICKSSYSLLIEGSSCTPWEKCPPSIWVRVTALDPSQLGVSMESEQEAAVEGMCGNNAFLQMFLFLWFLWLSFIWRSSLKSPCFMLPSRIPQSTYALNVAQGRPHPVGSFVPPRVCLILATPLPLMARNSGCITCHINLVVLMHSLVDLIHFIHRQPSFLCTVNSIFAYSPLIQSCLHHILKFLAYV